MRYYELTINTKEADSLLERVVSYLPGPPAQQQKQTSFLTLEFYTEPEKIQELEKKLKEDSLRYIILAKESVKKTAVKPIRKLGKTIKPKAELKEIEKKLEEILEET
ncbi:MAG TPA: hypothetical protein VMV66_02405 [Candidatus Humimicrobiaceae bacterium]|nr:hypothetical protein [Candidatus Humimicrobiaceae bacterium]